MYIARRQDEEREVPSFPPWWANGRQVEFDIKTRQTLHEILESLQSPLHSGRLQRHNNG